MEWTKQQSAELVKLYKSGVGATEISKIIAINKDYVATKIQRCKELGLIVGTIYNIRDRHTKEMIIKSKGDYFECVARLPYKLTVGKFDELKDCFFVNKLHSYKERAMQKSKDVIDCGICRHEGDYNDQLYNKPCKAVNKGFPRENDDGKCPKFEPYRMVQGVRV